MSFPQIVGISRVADNEKVLLLSLAVKPTDDDMRKIQDILRELLNPKTN
jgi:hypothetical protein